MPIDIDSAVAIDVHVHAEVSRDGIDPMPAHFREAAARYFGAKGDLPTADDVAVYYRERRIPGRMAPANRTASPVLNCLCAQDDLEPVFRRFAEAQARTASPRGFRAW